MKKLGILLVAAMLVSLLVVPASAQGITWTSGFQVQNLGDAAASCTITYYNQNGSQAAAVADTIPAASSKTYFPLSAVADGFNGSVVISSDQLLVAIANTLGNGTQYAASTESFSAGANSVQLPLIMRANAGYYTWFNVQNVGTADTSVTVQYIRGSDGNNYTAPAVTIAPGAAYTFNQRDLADLGTKFVGSAVVSSSSQPIVATVMQVGETTPTMMGYNAFTGGSTKVSMPLVMANNSGYFTGFQVQNVGSGTANVSIAYGTNLSGSFAPATESATLAPNESKTFIQSGGAWGSNKYVGSASITSNQPVVAIVNQLKMVAPAVGSAYDGFNPDAATSKVTMPLLMNANSGYLTGFQVMNVGTSDTTITVTFGPNTGGSYAPAAEVATIAPNNSYNSIQNKWGSNKYVGSATVVAGGGGKIVAIVNQIAPSIAGDQFMTYNGFNY